MAESFDPGALLGTTFALADGVRVRLRLARASDSGLIRALAARVQPGTPELEAERLIHFDPRRRAVVCATALIDRGETLVGVGAIELDPPGQAQTVIVDPRHAEPVANLLRAALAARAEAAAARRAA